MAQAALIVATTKLSFEATALAKIGETCVVLKPFAVAKSYIAIISQ